MSKLNDYTVGVLVGRFQVPSLHEAHKKLIQEVCNRHNNKVIVFVGVSPTLGTKENPLDFKCRKDMIEEAFPGIVVVPLADCLKDEVWSKNLDSQIRTIYPMGSVCLYGGRDSFLKCYKGNFDAYEFPTHDYRPGKEVRETIGKETINSEEFRKGVIYSTQNQYKRTHLTVDVCIYRKYKSDSKNKFEVLLGRKSNETRYRFIGGFVESEPLEEAARREASEEANVAIEGNLEFIGSYLVYDWRYEHTSDSVLTAFFAGECSWGGNVAETAGDDIEEVKWFDLKEVYNNRNEVIVKGHIKLIEKACEYFNLVKPKEEVEDEQE